MARNQLGGIFKPGKSLPLDMKEEIVDLHNSGYSINEIPQATLVTRRLVSGHKK